MRRRVYFDHCTRPWISDKEFDPRRHKHLTGEQARVIDAAVDAYNTTAADDRRATGGLFSLDGIHPTTVGYGLLAQELITVMERAGVVFRHIDSTVRPRAGADGRRSSHPA